MSLDFNHPTKSLLQQEQELLDSGEIENEDDLTRLYPNVIGNGHPDVCLCYACAPGEYDYTPGESWEDYESRTNYGYTDQQLQSIADSCPSNPQLPKDPGLHTVLEEDLKDFPF
jgi:hypothetical protein